MVYIVIDVETTGTGNKITEISIFRYENDALVDEFTSLVNPKTPIPDYITALTGIDDYMVAKAPTFSEISESILAITQGAVFIAHSVNFDYNVIRNEFKAIGINFNRKKLCTVRLSRKLLPGYKSYSLGKLCDQLDIPINGRHRARGDAEATVTLFKIILNQPNAQEVIQSFFKKESKEATLPSHLNQDTFNQLPNATGIYYFKNKKGTIIYVGKAKDIKKRVLSHFYSKTEKELNLSRETADVDFELSGSETIALLMEDAAIKHHFPKYNQAAKRIPKAYALFSYKDRKGVLHIAYNVLKATPQPIQVFYSIQECRHYLEILCKQFNLCPKYCHLQKGVTQCSHYEIKTCQGICKETESIALYNMRVNQAIAYFKNKSKDVILKQQGRNANEEAFIMIENSCYRGYGFIDREEQITTKEDLERYLIPQKDNVDIQRVLQKVLLM
ncbi:exonuclease domain-containing protein [Mariniflexile gromovii]|uniref:GIY-YIG nuclease family protein n=1 Tax=Mariniflexile gromovii TaxID=362523 RepID=A0ABS4BWD0_9FLAO|nr:exonuclease domain-containing protein [Mariniflexile gromovii]MBP0904893.1 GIY-YIG nuclease family protein [Mariniflexile gromovii]